MVCNILYIIYIQLWYTISYNIYFSCYIQFLRLFFDLWSKRCSTNIPTPYIVCLSPLLLAWHDPRCVITITSPVVIGTMSSADGNLVIKCPPEVYFVAWSIVIPMLHASPRIRGASQPRTACCVPRATSFRFRVVFLSFFFCSQLFLLINSN